MDWKAGIIKAKDLPEGETVYLKNSYKGWGVVHPIKNEDGTWNWFNFWTGGSWWNVLVTVVIILLLLGVVMEFSNIISYYTECFEGVLQLETCKDQLGFEELTLVDFNSFKGFGGDKKLRSKLV